MTHCQIKFLASPQHICHDIYIYSIFFVWLWFPKAVFVALIWSTLFGCSGIWVWIVAWIHRALSMQAGFDELPAPFTVHFYFHIRLSIVRRSRLWRKLTHWRTWQCVSGQWFGDGSLWITRAIYWSLKLWPCVSCISSLFQRIWCRKRFFSGRNARIRRVVSY